MDGKAEFEHLSAGMDQRDTLNTLSAMMQEMLAEMPDTPPPAPSITAGLVLYTKPQPGHAHPPMVQQQRSIKSNMSDGAVRTRDIRQGVPCEYCQGQKWNGQMLYRFKEEELSLPVEATPPPMASTLTETKSVCKQEDDKPYIKKPPNAFILFSRERRPSLSIKHKGSLSENKILGQMWSLLTSEEKSKFFDMANKERQQHALKHPNWSCKDNYGKKMYNRSKILSRVEVAKKRRALPAYVQGPSYSHTSVQGPSYSQTFVQGPSYSQTSVQRPSYSHTCVQGPSCSQTSVQRPSFSQTSVMGPPQRQTVLFGKPGAHPVQVGYMLRLPHTYDVGQY